MQENNIVEPVKKENKGLSIAAMVLGIVSASLFCIWYISIPCAILAIVFGAIERGKNKKNKYAKSGLILGIVGILISILFIVIVIIAMSVSIYDSAQEAIEETKQQKRTELMNQIRSKQQIEDSYYDFY